MKGDLTWILNSGVGKFKTARGLCYWLAAMCRYPVGSVLRRQEGGSRLTAVARRQSPPIMPTLYGAFKEHRGFGQNTPRIMSAGCASLAGVYSRISGSVMEHPSHWVASQPGAGVVHTWCSCTTAWQPVTIHSNTYRYTVWRRFTHNSNFYHTKKGYNCLYCGVSNDWWQYVNVYL